MSINKWLKDVREVTDKHIINHGGKWSLIDQIAHTHSEVSEVFHAIRDKESRERVLEEMSDSIYSAITMFHIYGASDEEIKTSLEKVLSKIQKRVGINESNN